MQVTLLSHVTHNGETYEAGAVLDLEDTEAQALIDAGVAEEVKEKKSKSTQKREKVQKEAKPAKENPVKRFFKGGSK